VNAFSIPSSVEGGLASLNAAGYVDVGVQDTHTASINWGDGSVTPGDVNQGANTVSGSHSYIEDGSYLVTVTVTDDDGGVGSNSFTVSVSNVAPGVEAGSIPSINEGGSVSLTPASFFDAGSTDTHTASINSGDGIIEASAVSESNGLGSVSGSHTYMDDDDYTVTVTDDDCGFGSNWFDVTVSNAAPAVEAGSIQPITDATCSPSSMVSTEGKSTGQRKTDRSSICTSPMS
jgi:hypothetical protein